MSEKELIFISWSGIQSGQVGDALNDFLKKCLPTVETFFSPDIEGGVKWDAEIANNLKKASAGIVIITPHNKDKPWILYEAGAMAVSYEDKRVVPLLVDIKKSDIEAPLGTLNAKELKKEELKKLILEFNRAFTEVDKDTCESYFDSFYDEFEEKIKNVDKEKTPVNAGRTQEQKVDEILNTVRNLDRRVFAQHLSGRSKYRTMIGPQYFTSDEGITYQVNDEIMALLHRKEKQSNEFYKEIYKKLHKNLSRTPTLENCIELAQIFKGIHTHIELRKFEDALRSGDIAEARKNLKILVKFFEKPLELDEIRLSNDELKSVNDYISYYLDTAEAEK